METENLFYFRLRELQKIFNKSINQIERDLGYPRNSLNNYKNGVEPSGTRVIELAHYFGVSPEYLLGKNVQKTQTIKEIFYDFNTSQKKEMYLLCQSWLISYLEKERSSEIFNM